MEIRCTLRLEAPRSWVRAALFAGSLAAVFGSAIALVQAGAKLTTFAAGEVVSSSAIDANFQALAANSVPDGTVIFWACPKGAGCAAADIPAGYWVCDGATVVSGTGTAWDGQKTPDLIDAFAMGAPLAQNQKAGGANTLSISHTHTYDVSHTLPATTTEPAPDHQHQMALGFDDARIYGWLGNPSDGGPIYGSSVTSASSESSIAFTTTATSGLVRVPNTSLNGGHSHAIDPVMYMESPRTTSDATVTGTSGAVLTDSRPAYVGLLPLLKASGP